METKPRILIVDDDRTTLSLARKVLETADFIVDEAADGFLAIKQARRVIPDLILLDVQMPKMDGFETCRRIRADKRLKAIPVIIATGLGDMTSIESAYRFGATNFIVKPIQWNTLPHNIKFVLRSSMLETNLHHMALHDDLTGLPNRTMLHDLLRQAIALGRRNHKHVAVLMLDLDGFKHINDSLGHHVGDQLLKLVALRLRASLRESDIFARLGGDEFLIALPDLKDDESAASAAQSVLSLLASPYHVDGNELNISGSIGISLFPSDGDDPGALVRAADTAMYDAKDNGRGTYRFFTVELNEAAKTRLALMNDLSHALERDEFVLHYQPQVALDSGIITGVEALLRWNHPQRGLVSPAQFIPILEDTRGIVDVGKWVLQTACNQNAVWQRAGLRPIRMGVNLSAVQFYRDDIVKTVESALRNSGINAESLELEFTESLTINDVETTLEAIGDLKGLGVHLSIDDFGTGCSSLSYLRRFPIDRIKIDQSFMRDITSHESDSAVVRSIIDLAKHLGLACTAEGVETVEQLRYLQRHMCAEMQGFFFSRPLPEYETSMLLRSGKKLTPL